MLDTSPYNGIEHDVLHVLPPNDQAPEPAKVVHDLTALLAKTLAFLKVKVIGPTEWPGQINILPGEVWLLVKGRRQIPIDLGGSLATAGVRTTKLHVVQLYGVLAGTQVPEAQYAKMADNLPVFVERVIKRNCYLPDADGVNQLDQQMEFIDDDISTWRYGSTPAPNPRPAFWRTRFMRVEVVERRWFPTEAGDVG